MADWIIRFRFGGIESSLEYLETMAAKGWMLEYWQENTLLFRHAEPRKLRFTMDIIPIGMWKIDSDEHNAAIKADYLSMYEEMGWQYVENQGRKFIFCTEDETLPLPQTDPVAYEETIYEKHKSNMCRYLAACLIHLMMFAHIWRYQYMYLTSLKGVSLIGCFVCTLIFCGLGLINNGISVFREHRDLRNGIIPKYWGSEWFGRGMLVCFGAVVGIAGYVAEKELGKYAWIMIGFILCVMLQMAVGNIGPWVFWRWGKMSKELAAKRTKQAVNTFILCGGLLLASGIKNVGIEDSRTWPEGTVPVITAEEVFDVVYEKTSDAYKDGEYQQGWAKLYIYGSRVEGIPFCYRLLISGWEPTIRSFERNPEIFSLLSTAYRRDTLAYWEDDMQILDHETLGAKHAWLVRQDDYFTYRYYLEVDGAAMLIQTGRELDEHWLRVICQRLTTIIQ